MKTLKLVVTCFVLIIFFTSCEKEFETTPDIVAEEPLSNEVLATTLTVNCLSSRSLNPGGTFQHEFVLKNGNNPIANTMIGINDPIGLMCTWVTTNSQGKATWNRTTNSSTPRKAYTFEFFYGNTKVLSTVAVKPLSSATSLSTYRMNFTSTSTLNNSTLVGSSRGGFQTVSQTQNTTLQEAINLGKDVVKDYVKNPGNIVITTVAAVSCTAGQLIPGAGQTTCVVSATMVAKNFAASTVKVTAKYAIDKNTAWSTSTKTSLKAIVDLASTAYSFTKLKPGEGIKALDALPAYYDVLTTQYGQLIYDASGVLRGGVIATPLNGTNEIMMMCFYKR